MAKSRIALALALLLACGGMIGWHRHFGFIDFGGMDGGVVIQAGWTVANGSIPYTDVPDPLPPLFFLAPGLAFKLGGVSWSSLNGLVCVFAILTFLWSFFLLARVCGRPWTSLFFAIVFQGVTLLPLSWWWYNQTTSLVTLLALLSGFGLARAPADRLCALSLGAAAALLFLCKINTAAPVSAFLVVVLLVRRETRRAALLALGGAAMADALLFLVLHLSPLAYLGLISQFSVRLSSGSWTRYCFFYSLPSEHLVGILFFLVLTLADVVLIWFQREAARQRDLLLWFVIALAASLIEMTTNNDFKVGDTLYVLLVAALAWPETKWPGPFLVGGALAVVPALFLLLLGLLFGIARSRVTSMGSPYYSDGQPATRVLDQPAFFHGLVTEDLLVRVLGQVEANILPQPGVPAPSRHVFFGPRLDFCYAAYGIPFPKGLPIWWEKVPSSHRGEQYPMGPSMPDFLGGPSRWLPDDAPDDPRVQRFIDAQFDACLFLRGYNHIADMTYLPPNLRGYIYEHYRRVDFPDIVVFTRQ